MLNMLSNCAENFHCDFGLGKIRDFVAPGSIHWISGPCALLAVFVSCDELSWRHFSWKLYKWFWECAYKWVWDSSYSFRVDDFLCLGQLPKANLPRKMKENKAPYDFGWEIRCTYLCNTGPYLNWSLVPKSS